MITWLRFAVLFSGFFLVTLLARFSDRMHGHYRVSESLASIAAETAGIAVIWAGLMIAFEPANWQRQSKWTLRDTALSVAFVTLWIAAEFYYFGWNRTEWVQELRFHSGFYLAIFAVIGVLKKVRTLLVEQFPENRSSI